MVVLYQSQTSPINPVGVEPVLSIEQFWEVLVIKARQPELFIEPIASAKILDETETTMKREISFREGMGPQNGKAIENITLKKPLKAYFRMEGEDATYIENIVSQGKDKTDLYLTFYFEWNLPKIEERSEEAEQRSSELWSLARGAVQHTVDVARQFFKDGEVGKV